MLHKLWDDVVAGPQPERGLGKFRKIQVDTTTNNINDNKNKGSSSGPISVPVAPATSAPTTPAGTPSPKSVTANVWRSVFHPGSNLNSKTVGAHYFDKPTHSTSPTTYDWLYSEETRSKYQ
ncbi:hypothetical protein V2J09_000423 [Rumex salicifolius]